LPAPRPINAHSSASRFRSTTSATSPSV
jgi:hypothetical protein